jgi:DNA-binding winged helix-turn-helix (wHTH) protein
MSVLLVPREFSGIQMPAKPINANDLETFSDGSSTRFWRFGDCEFDELGRQLWFRGERVNLESKTLDVLLYLLLHAGEAVTNEELLEAVWPDLIFVDESLTAAISRLRDAIRNWEHSVIVTVPQIGYRIAVPVLCKMFAGHVNLSSGLKDGIPVPRSDQWQLKRILDPST